VFAEGACEERKSQLHVLVVGPKIPGRLQADTLMCPTDTESAIKVRLVEDSFEQTREIVRLMGFELFELLRIAQKRGSVRMGKQVLVKSIRKFASMGTKCLLEGADVLGVPSVNPQERLPLTVFLILHPVVRRERHRRSLPLTVCKALSAVI